MKAFSWLVTILTLTLYGCASTFPVFVDYDHQYRFPAKPSYSIVQPEEIETASNDLLKNRVIDALRAELSQRGWQEVEQEKAQIWVSFFASSTQKQDLRVYQSYNSFYGYSRCLRCGYVAVPTISSEAYVVDYAEKTLTIDMIDPKSNQLKWRGRTRSRVSQGHEDSLTVSERIERINQAVRAVLAEFPPAAESPKQQQP